MAADPTPRVLLACAMLLVAAAPFSAQETGDEQEDQPMFFDSVDVDVVNVEVVVTDKDGRPVTGLTRDDFEILEDGRQVELTHFLEVRAKDRTAADGISADTTLPAADATPTPEAPPADEGRPRHVVILVDNMNVSPQSRKRLFARLREHLQQRSDPRTRVMLATLDRRVEIVLPFTSDRQRLLASLDEVERRSSSHALLDGDRRIFLKHLQQARLRDYQPPRSVVQSTSFEGESDPDFNDAIRVALELAYSVRALGEQRYRRVETTLEALSRFCEALGGMPDRKALIYLSDGLPKRPADSLAEAWSGRFQSWALQNAADIRNHSPYPEADQSFERVLSLLDSTELDLGSAIHRLAEGASAQRVAFYPVSTYGLSPGFLSTAASGAGIAAGAGSMMRSSQNLENSSRDASLLQLAEETGGLALIRSADLGRLLERVDRDFTTYYAIGYRPPIPELEDDQGTTDAAGENSRKRTAAEAELQADPDHRTQVGDAETFRKTEVKVKRKAAVVRHGRGYNPRSWRDRLGAMTLASALFNVESNPIRAELELGQATREGDRFRLPILLTVPFDQIQLVYHEDQYIGQLTALVVVRDEGEGDFSAPQRIDLPIKISGRRILEAVHQQAGYIFEIEIDRGPQRVAVGLRDHFARTEATVNLGIVVGEGTS